MIDIFEESAQEYHGWFDRNEPIYQSELLAIKAFLPPAGRGLEIGAGTGRFAAPVASGISICGVAQGGKCEVSATLKCDVPCVWALIYDRLSELGELDRLTAYCGPKDWRSAGACGPRQLLRKDH